MNAEPTRSPGLFVVLGVVAVVFLFALVTGRLSVADPSTSSARQLPDGPQSITGGEIGRVVGQPSIDPTFDPPDAYPGGNTPAPVPTQTDIPPAAGKYVGWTGQQIASDLIARYEGATPPRAIAPTTYVDSRIITPADAGAFGLEPNLIAFQSPDDHAVVLTGTFPAALPGSYATPLPDAQAMLVIVDIYSGAVRKFKFSDDVQVLLDLLP